MKNANRATIISVGAHRSAGMQMFHFYCKECCDFKCTWNKIWFNLCPNSVWNLCSPSQCGSTEYMAPEVVEVFTEEALFHVKPCDLWSLGSYFIFCWAAAPPSPTTGGLTVAGTEERPATSARYTHIVYIPPHTTSPVHLTQYYYSAICIKHFFLHL